MYSLFFKKLNAVVYSIVCANVSVYTNGTMY